MKAIKFCNAFFIQPIVWSVLGFSFCLWNKLAPASVPCVSSGCRLYQSGVESPAFWTLGCISFFVLFVCAILNKPKLGKLFAGIGLTLDLCFFFIMVLTAPCVSCVVTGICLALCYRAFIIKSSSSEMLREGVCVLRHSFLLFVWSLLLIVNLGLLVRGSVSPWSLNTGNTEELSSAVFFSPSCYACRMLVESIPESQVRKIAWYPVMDGPQDLEAIEMLRSLVIDNAIPMAEAMKRAAQVPTLSWKERLKPSYLLLQFRLWVNSAHVLSFGDGRLPLLEIRGMPEFLRPQNQKGKEVKNMTNSSDVLPFELDIVEICGESKESKESQFQCAEDD